MKLITAGPTRIQLPAENKVSASGLHAGFHFASCGMLDECCGCINSLASDNAGKSLKTKASSNLVRQGCFLCKLCLIKELRSMRGFFDHRCSGCAKLFDYSKVVEFIDKLILESSDLSTDNSSRHVLIANLLSKVLKETTIDAFLFSLNLNEDGLRQFSKYLQDHLLSPANGDDDEFKKLQACLQLLEERISYQVMNWGKSLKLQIEEIKKPGDKATKRLFLYQKYLELRQGTDMQWKLAKMLKLSELVKGMDAASSTILKEFLITAIVPMLNEIDLTDFTTEMEDPDDDAAETVAPNATSDAETVAPNTPADNELQMVYRIIRNTMTSVGDFTNPVLGYLLESIHQKNKLEEYSEDLAELKLAHTVFASNSFIPDLFTTYVNSMDFTIKLHRLSTWILNLMGERVERAVDGEYVKASYDEEGKSEKNESGKGEKSENAKENAKNALSNDNKNKTNVSHGISNRPKTKKSKGKNNKKQETTVQDTKSQGTSDSDDFFEDCIGHGAGEHYEDCTEEFRNDNNSEIDSLVPENDTFSALQMRFIMLITTIYKKMTIEAPSIVTTANFYEIARKTHLLADLKEIIMADINKQLESITPAVAVSLICMNDLINKEFIYDCILLQSNESKSSEPRLYQFINMISSAHSSAEVDMILLKIFDFGFFCPENHADTVKDFEHSLNVKQVTNNYYFLYMTGYAYYIIRNYEKLNRAVSAYKDVSGGNINQNDVENELKRAEMEKAENPFTCNVKKDLMCGQRNSGPRKAKKSDGKKPVENDSRQLEDADMSLIRLRSYMEVYKDCFKEFEARLAGVWHVEMNYKSFSGDPILFGLNLEMEAILREERMLKESEFLIPTPTQITYRAICSLLSSGRGSSYDQINEMVKRGFKRVLNDAIRASLRKMSDHQKELDNDRFMLKRMQDELKTLKNQNDAEKMAQMAADIDELNAVVKNKSVIDRTLDKIHHSIYYHVNLNLLKKGNTMKQIYRYYSGKETEVKMSILFCYLKTLCFARARAVDRTPPVINPRYSNIKSGNCCVMKDTEYFKYKKEHTDKAANALDAAHKELLERKKVSFRKPVSIGEKQLEIKKIFWKLINELTLSNFDTGLTWTSPLIKDLSEVFFEDMITFCIKLSEKDADRQVISPLRYFDAMQKLLTIEDLENSDYLSPTK